MDEITLAMLGFMVCFAVSLIALGVSLDRRKIKEEVKYMIQPAKQYVSCSRCRAWTSLATSNMFEGIGILCLKCTQTVLVPKKEVQAPVFMPAKKRSGFMSFIKGSQDEY